VWTEVIISLESEDKMSQNCSGNVRSTVRPLRVRNFIWHKLASGIWAFFKIARSTCRNVSAAFRIYLNCASFRSSDTVFRPQNFSATSRSVQNAYLRGMFCLHWTFYGVESHFETNKQSLSECVDRVLRPARHTADHFGDESFQAISW